MLAPVQSKPYFAWLRDVTCPLHAVAKESKELPVLEGYLGFPLAVLVPHARLRP
jgi:hypothetical protein